MEITQTETPLTKEAPKPIDPVIEEMTKAGLHFGHKTSKTHPKMKPYIAGVRNTIHIIDLEKTKEKLAQALEYIGNAAKAGKTIVLVGTKVQLRSIVEQTAKECKIPYVSQRWIGGTFTNFDTISKRITEMLDLEKKKEAGELSKYTKKEQLEIDRRIQELEVKYGGLRALTKVPDIVFVCDPDTNELTLREAERKHVSMVAICDTNMDPSPIDYMIPANDDAISSVSYILNKVKETILTNKPVIL